MLTSTIKLSFLFFFGRVSCGCQGLRQVWNEVQQWKWGEMVMDAKTAWRCVCVLAVRTVELKAHIMVVVIFVNRWLPFPLRRLCDCSDLARN